MTEETLLTPVLDAWLQPTPIAPGIGTTRTGTGNRSAGRTVSSGIGEPGVAVGLIRHFGALATIVWSELELPKAEESGLPLTAS
jgi:hypothetical protein